MTSDQNKYTYIDDTEAEILSCYKVVKKSRNSKLKKKLKSLENRFDLLDDELLEIKWEIDDIRHEMSCSTEKRLSKTKSSITPNILPESNSSDEDDTKYHAS